MSRRVVVVSALAVIGALLAVGLCWAGPAEDLAQATELYASGNFDGALQRLATASSPDAALFAEALKLTAYCYRAKANTSEAHSTFEKLVFTYPKSSAITPDVDDNILALGYCTKSGDEEAVSIYLSMAGKYPDDSVIWRYLASDALRSQGKEAEALVELLRAYDKPASKPNRIWEAKANVMMYSVSFSDFERTIPVVQSKLNENLGEDRLLWEYVLGYAYLCTGDYQNAVNKLGMASQLVDVDRKYVKHGRIWRSVKYALGQAYEKNKAYDKALPLYKEVAQKYPGFWRGQYGVFVCFAKQDELAQASAYINKVCSEQAAIKDKLRQLTTSYMLSEME